LKFLTFLTEQEIKDLVKEARTNPKARIMQHRLAIEVTEFVHGTKGVETALKISEALFTGNLRDLNKETFLIAFNALPHVEMEENTTLIEALIASEAASSKREAREFLKANAISVNDIVITDENQKVRELKPYFNDYYLIRRGKKKFVGIKIV
jgi:tyrosyl-tRNA synthetase